jgi:hypothetical protein
MQASLDYPLRPMTCVDTDRRREQREPRSTLASVVMAGKAPAGALLTDVSLYGCCVETTTDWLRPGRCIAIGLAGGHSLDSIVRWSRDGLAGLELLRPVTAEQLEWLALID